MIATYLQSNKKAVKMLFCRNSDQWPNNMIQDKKVRVFEIINSNIFKTQYYFTTSVK